jgi:hypothetical protein
MLIGRHSWWIVKINGKLYAYAGGDDGALLSAIRRHQIR